MHDDEVLARCRALLQQGGGIEEAIGELRLGGLSKVGSIKVLVDLGLADAAGAKRAVHESPVWGDVREQHDDFHRVLASSLDATEADGVDAARADSELPLRIELAFGDLAAAPPISGVYDPEHDTIVSILCDVCEALEGLGKLTFEGFGCGRWWMDIRCDLSILLESLPIAIGAIAARRDFSIDLYEQGHELRLLFVVDGDAYVARAVKLESDEPKPGMRIERIDRVALEAMLAAVVDEFVRAVRERYPLLLDHPWVQGWLDGETVW